MDTSKQRRENPLRILYLGGILLILALPLVNIPPWFSPPGWGNPLAFRIILGGLLLLTFWQALFRPRDLMPIPFSRPARRIVFALFALLGIFFLSATTSLDPVFSFWGDPVRGWGFVNYASYAVFALFLFWVAGSFRAWKLMWGGFIAIGILLVSVAFFQQAGALSSILVETEIRPGSTLGNPLFLSAFLLPLIFICLALGITDKTRGRFFFFGSIPVFLFGLLLALSRSGFLGLGVGAFFFFLMFPNKSAVMKRWAGATGIAIASIVLLANLFPSPRILQESSAASLWGHLSLSSAAQSDRFDVWRVMGSAIRERPILGYGMYNVSPAFDRHYDEAKHTLIAQSGKDSWFDSSHNIFVDITVWAGIPGLLAFFAFLATLFGALRHAKNSSDASVSIRAHGAQVALVAYLVHMMFVFDVFSTYLVFFALAAYAMHLTSQLGEPKLALGKLSPTCRGQVFRRFRVPVFAAVCTVFAVFVWQYNTEPLFASASVNTAGYLIKEGRCQEAISMTKNGLEHYDTFINAYTRISALEHLRDCAARAPQSEKIDLYKQAYDTALEAADMRPTHTRTWLFLSGFSALLLQTETEKPAPDPNLLKEYQQTMDQALEKARTLSPKRQEIYLAQIRDNLTAKNYDMALSAAEDCISASERFAGCRWHRGLGLILEEKTEEGQNNMDQAERLGFSPRSRDLLQLAGAYIASGNYSGLAETYERLIKIDDQNPQYYASLAVAYRNLGEFEKARQAALGVLQLQPGNKGVEEFIQSLP